jgi:hypothetical protein
MGALWFLSGLLAFGLPIIIGTYGVFVLVSCIYMLVCFCWHGIIIRFAVKIVYGPVSLL